MGVSRSPRLNDSSKQSDESKPQLLGVDITTRPLKNPEYMKNHSNGFHIKRGFTYIMGLFAGVEHVDLPASTWQRPREADADTKASRAASHVAA